MAGSAASIAVIALATLLVLLGAAHLALAGPTLRRYQQWSLNRHPIYHFPAGQNKTTVRAFGVALVALAAMLIFAVRP